MAWSFRKRIKVAPGVNVNVSKSGVSTSVGPKGAKINVGPKGSKLYTSIPGTGIYYRGTLSKTANKESSGSVEPSSKKSNGEGSVFYGCFVNWRCFTIWVGIIIISIFLFDGIKNVDIEWWKFTLLSSLIIGALLLLWHLNGGHLKAQPARRRFWSITWGAFVVVILLLFSTYSRINKEEEKTIIAADDTVIVEEQDHDSIASINIDEIDNQEEVSVASSDYKHMFLDLIIGCYVTLSLIFLVIFLTYIIYRKQLSEEKGKQLT